MTRVLRLFLFKLILVAFANAVMAQSADEVQTKVNRNVTLSVTGLPKMH